MQNFSMKKVTIWGGSFFARGFIPKAARSSLNGRHQFMSVFTVTPAHPASSDLVIAFILVRNFTEFERSKRIVCFVQTTRLLRSNDLILCLLSRDL